MLCVVFFQQGKNKADQIISDIFALIIKNLRSRRSMDNCVSKFKAGIISISISEDKKEGEEEDAEENARGSVGWGFVSSRGSIGGCLVSSRGSSSGSRGLLGGSVCGYVVPIQQRGVVSSRGSSGGSAGSSRGSIQPRRTRRSDVGDGVVVFWAFYNLGAQPSLHSVQVSPDNRRVYLVTGVYKSFSLCEGIALQF